MAGLTTQEEGVRASLKAGDYYGSAYAQVYTGYFKAPTTGTYTFNSQADDAFALYLSTSYGSYDDAAPILLHTSSYQSGYPYFDGMSSAVNTVAL